MIGKAFVDARFLAIPFLVLPTIGLLERAGLRVRARAFVPGSYNNLTLPTV